MSTTKEEKLKQEQEAKRKRELAIKYLHQEGQSMKTISAELHEKSKVTKDNTLELLLKEKTARLTSSSNSHISTESILRNSVLLAQNEEPKEQFVVDDLTKWQKVLDPKSGLYYYWNSSTNETTWTKPIAKKPIAQSSTVQTSGLPDGWTEQIHHATKQVFYVHTATGEKRWSKPESAEAATDIPSAALKRKRDDVTTHSVGGIAPSKRLVAGKIEVDPLDPSAALERNGANRNRFVIEGSTDGSRGLSTDRMADSTASGALWQQRYEQPSSFASNSLLLHRPYPAPGNVLRSRK